MMRGTGLVEIDDVDTTAEVEEEAFPASIALVVRFRKRSSISRYASDICSAYVGP